MSTLHRDEVVNYRQGLDQQDRCTQTSMSPPSPPDNYHRLKTTMTVPKRVAFKVHGTVQGVGFRDFTQKCATSYGLLGWVRNTTCGRVEGEAQGDGETVQKFLAQIDRGPRLAHVVKLEKREMETTQDEDHFAVMRTMDSMFNSGS